MLIYISGLPDRIYSNQKSKFGQILERLGMENVCIFYDHFENLRSFGIICSNLANVVAIWYIFSRFVALYQEQSGNPDIFTSQK
jgi:hypothetical protein